MTSKRRAVTRNTITEDSWFSASRRAIAAAPKRREADVQREIMRLFVARGWLVLPLNREAAGSKGAWRIGMKGCADVIAFAPYLQKRAPIFVEIKAPKASTQRGLARWQAAFGKLVVLHGCDYLMISPRDPRTGCEQVCDFMGWPR